MRRVIERVSAFAGALARIETDTETYRAELRAAEDALAGLPETRRAGSAARRGAGSRWARSARAPRRRGFRRSAPRTRQTARQRRLADIAEERERWARASQRAGERVAELKERLAALDTEIAAVPDDPSIFAERRRALAGEMDAASAALAAAEDELAAAETAHRDAQEAARAALDALSEARERRGRDEERVIAAEARKSELAAQIAEHFDWQIDELRDVAGLAPEAELPEATAVETRLHKLKAERERLGGVNLRAEEEMHGA